MIYRLLAINVDGTLLKSNGRLTKETKEAIAYAKKQDVYITLVTSRNFPSTKKIAKSLKLDDSILITHGGAYLSSEVDNPFYEKRISHEKTFDIVNMLESYDCNIRVLHESFSIGNKLKQKGNFIGKTIFGSNDPLFYPLQFVNKLSERLIEEPTSTPKIDLHFWDSLERDKVKNDLEETFPYIDVIKVDEFMLEVVPKGISKLSGLKRLGEHLNISLEEMVAIGDSYNDISMIEQVGLGVAMGHSANEVKKASDWVTRSNEQQGVAYMVKEQFRKQDPIRVLKKAKK